MSSIITSILRSTVGLLWNKARDSTAEKLQGGDVTDAKIRKLVVREMNDLATKLDALSRQDLNTSYTNLQEGLHFLNASLDRSNRKALTNGSGRATSKISSNVGSDVLNEVLKLSQAVRVIKLDSDGMFESANERFKEARKKANEALSIETLSIKEKIFAVKLRILSEVFECLGNPENVIIGCLPVLEKLHALPAIQDIFNVYLDGGIRSLITKAERAENVKSVMLINYVLFQYLLKFTRENPALCWPAIELGDRSFHPILHWTEISTRTSMAKELDQHPGTLAFDDVIFPHLAVLNSRSDVCTVNAPGYSIQVISRTGESKRIALPTPKQSHNVTGLWAVELAVDQHDKIYVLMIRLETQTENGVARRFALGILQDNCDVKHTCLLDFLEVIQRGVVKMVINVNNDIIMSQQHDHYVYVCDGVGHLKHKFETTTLVSQPILDINEKNEMIISCLLSTGVRKYSDKGNLKTTIALPDHEVVSVAFNHVMNKVIVLTRKDGSYFLVSCSESGKVENTTLFCKDVDIYDITINSHLSGPIAVIMKNNITFI